MSDPAPRTRHRTAAIAAALAIASLVAVFGIWSVELLIDVRELRASLERQVRCLIALQQVEDTIRVLEPDGAGAAELSSALDSLRGAVADLATHAELPLETAEVAQRMLQYLEELPPPSDDFSSRVVEAHDRTAALMPSLRAESARLSVELGERWDALNLLVAGSLGLAALTLLFLVVLLWFARRLRRVEAIEREAVAQRERTELLEEAARGARIGIAIIDSNGVPTQSNPVLVDMTADWDGPNAWWQAVAPLLLPPDGRRGGGDVGLAVGEATEIELASPTAEARVFELIRADEHKALGDATSGCLLLVLDRTRERQAISAEHDALATLVSWQSDLRSVLEASTMCIAVHRQGQVVYANPALGQLLGRDPNELAQTRWRDLITEPPADAPIDWSPDGGEVGCYRGRKRDRIIVELSKPQPIAFDERTASLTVVRDVTEIRAARRHLELTHELMIAGLVAGGLADRIRDPLAQVYGTVLVLRRALEAIELAHPRMALGDLHSVLDDIDSGLARVRRVTNGLLPLDRRDDETGPADPRNVLDGAIHLIEAALGDTGRVVREYSDVPAVAATSSDLRQIVVSLLLNAVQALSPASESGRITVRTLRQGSTVTIEIEDTGRGLTDAELGRAFDPIQSAPLGSGLALYLCRQRVRALNGEIHVASRPGAGTTVSLSLPVAAPRAEPAESSRPPPAADGSSRRRVLIIDDEIRVGRALARALRECAVDVVTDGESGLERCRDAEFDIIFCDLMMPNVSGIDFYTRVRQERPGLEERIVFISGGAFTATARDFLRDVDNILLQKPFELDRIRELVAALPGSGA